MLLLTNQIVNILKEYYLAKAVEFWPCF